MYDVNYTRILIAPSDEFIIIGGLTFKINNRSTYRELVYLVLDELKLVSDDSSFTEDHVIYLLDRYRPFLLK